MKASRLFFSTVLPPIIWLLFGGPDLALAGNAVLFLTVVVHLYVVIWNDFVFGLLRGDAFTYGMVTRAINMVSFLTSLVVGWLALLALGDQAASLSSVPKPALGVMILSLLLTIALPLLTSRQVSRLPTAADRRTFHDPREDQQ